MKLSRFFLPLLVLLSASFSAAQGNSQQQSNTSYKFTIPSENMTFPVTSFSWGVSNPTIIGGGGGGASKASFSSLNLMKPLDSNTGAIMLATAQGTHFPSARLEGFLNNSSTPFLTITIETVAVESAQISGSVGTIATESVSFAYGKITINGVSWNVVDNQPLALQQKLAMQQLIAKITADALKGGASKPVKKV